MGQPNHRLIQQLFVRPSNHYQPTSVETISEICYFGETCNETWANAYSKTCARTCTSLLMITHSRSVSRSIAWQQHWIETCIVIRCWCDQRGDIFTYTPFRASSKLCYQLKSGGSLTDRHGFYFTCEYSFPFLIRLSFSYTLFSYGTSWIWASSWNLQKCLSLKQCSGRVLVHKRSLVDI